MTKKIKPKHKLEKPKNQPDSSKAEAKGLPSAPKSSGFKEDYKLPEQYDSTAVTLIARDPHWVYAYWDVAKDSLENLHKRLGDKKFEHAKHVMRVYDVTSENKSSFDIDVGPYTKDWYINVTKDNAKYSADLGLLSPDGKFHVISHSNIISTQRETLSNRSDMIWMNVQKDKPKETFVYANPLSKKENGSKGLKKSDDISIKPEAKLNEILNENDDFPKKIKLRINLTEDDVKNYYIQKFPLLSKVQIKNRKARAFGLDLDESELESIFKTDAYFLKSGRINSEQSFDSGLSLIDLYDDIFYGSSEQKKLGRPKDQGGASEILGSSSDLMNPPKEHNFFFDLKTELIVTGKTDPSAEVYWQNQKIVLQPDGTFTLRLSLPDQATIPLDFVAKSHNGIDIRTINTQVQRSNPPGK